MVPTCQNQITQFKTPPQTEMWRLYLPAIPDQRVVNEFESCDALELTYADGAGNCWLGNVTNERCPHQFFLYFLVTCIWLGIVISKRSQSTMLDTASEDDLLILQDRCDAQLNFSHIDQLQIAQRPQ